MARRAFDPAAFMQREALKDLAPFIGPAQMSAIRAAMRGEEGDYFTAKCVELAALVTSMPVIGDTSEQPDATAHLHYFKGSCDFYIIERDNVDGEPQLQAYGLANLGHGGEFGYISIEEITRAGVELDMHFSPRPISECAK